MCWGRSMVKKKAFITGINGQDGSYLAELLLEKDYDVYGIVRRNSITEHQRNRLSHLDDKIELSYGDLTDKTSIDRALSVIKPDEIYNLGAQSHVRVSFEIPQFTFETNAIGVYNILESMRHFSPKSKFYQASSSEMFGRSVDDDGFGNLRMFYNTGTRRIYTNLTAGTVNYDNGNILFGPVNIIGTGSNIPSSGVAISNSITGVGSVSDPGALPNNLQIPVQIIPANSGTIPSATPGTVLNIISPEVSVQPIGTTPPSSIPLNSLTPTIFDQTPTVVSVNSVTNGGSLNT